MTAPLARPSRRLSSVAVVGLAATAVALLPNSIPAAHGFAPPRSPSSSRASSSPIATTTPAMAAARPYAYAALVGDGGGEDGVDRPTTTTTTTSPRSPVASAAASALAFSLLLGATTAIAAPPAAHASDYASYSTEQRLVAEAWRTVDSAYIDRTFNHQDWFKLRQDAIKKKYKNIDEARNEVDKILGSLGDRYTRYLSPAKYDSIVNAATGNVFGVGVELALDKEGGRVVASDVEPTGPAFRGGLRPGDVFAEVDGVRFDDGKATPDDVALVVRGPEGSRVGMLMEREGKSMDFILTREPIKITSVRSYVGEKQGVSGKVGVVRIKNFSGTTADTVKAELESVKKKGATSIVLDLRGNPGGLLPGGVDTASLFLEKDRPVVYVVDKKGVVDAQSTLADGIDLSSPLILLVDKNTASAAEVMTAALRENGRATVAGERTFGKGIVQTIRSLESGGEGNNGGVAVTIARYETPDRNDINKRGIPADVEASVDCGKEDALACLPKEAFRN